MRLGPSRNHVHAHNLSGALAVSCDIASDHELTPTHPFCTRDHLNKTQAQTSAGFQTGAACMRESKKLSFPAIVPVWSPTISYDVVLLAFRGIR